MEAVSFFTEKQIAAKVDYLKKTFKCSDAEVSRVVCRAPMVLRMSNDSLQLRSGFLIFEAWLEPPYIARFPTLILHSLQGRIRPRHHVVKFLKENGLLDRNWSYYSIVNATEKVFTHKFMCPHKEAAPHLAQDYATACQGEVPARLIIA
jgi:mTERF domain-containing protein